jgi:hypothetical protein
LSIFALFAALTLLLAFLPDPNPDNPVNPVLLDRFATLNPRLKLNHGRGIGIWVV